MSLDRAIMLPHEFDKKEESPIADGGVAVGVSDRSTVTSVKWPRGSGESLPNSRPQMETDPDDGKRNE